MSINAQYILDSDIYRYTSTLADKSGVPLTNRFLCRLQGPPAGHDAAKDGVSATNQWLDMQVISANCPSFSFDLTQQDLNGYQRFVAKARNDNDITITFLDSCDLKLRRYFYRWMQWIATINEKGSRRMFMADVCAPIFIIAPLNANGLAEFGDVFKYVMPTQIQDIDFNYQTSGEIVKTIVTFKFMLHNMASVDNLLDAANQAISKHT